MDVSAHAVTRQALGEAIIHGNDEILRLIGGTIVREMIDNGASPSDFLPADIHSDSSLIFPDKPTHNSQWTTEFIDYVDGLETQGLLTQE